MASAFGHAFAAIALGTSLPKVFRSWKLWLLAIGCSILPDADVIGFYFDISYGSFWGHRGFSHSLVFALGIGIIITITCYNKYLFTSQGLLLILFFSMATASHAVLDALTSGGLGVAFFSPWDDTRHFFPWRPIQVSPIGIDRFFSSWGLKVLLSELIYIGIPGGVWIISMKIIRTIRNHRN